MLIKVKCVNRRCHTHSLLISACWRLYKIQTRLVVLGNYYFFCDSDLLSWLSLNSSLYRLRGNYLFLLLLLLEYWLAVVVYILVFKLGFKFGWLFLDGNRFLFRITTCWKLFFARWTAGAWMFAFWTVSFWRASTLFSVDRALPLSLIFPLLRRDLRQCLLRTWRLNAKNPSCSIVTCTFATAFIDLTLVFGPINGLQIVFKFVSFDVVLFVVVRLDLVAVRAEGLENGHLLFIHFK